jgi:hypothetical protein
VVNRLKKLNTTYDLPDVLKVELPKQLDDAISKLRERSGACIQKMPPT